jgi:hypothetical protein
MKAEKKTKKNSDIVKRGFNPSETGETDKWQRYDHPLGWEYMKYLYLTTGVIPEYCPPMLKATLDSRKEMYRALKE